MRGKGVWVKAGDIVYFTTYDWRSGKYGTNFGVAEEPLEDGTCYVDLVCFADYRYINGIHINDFLSETEWRKLPKDWTYDTELFTVEDRTPDEVRERYAKTAVADVAAIKALIRDGCLILAKDRFNGVVEAEIDRHKGWRIVKHYPSWTVNYANQTKTYERFQEKDLYPTFSEALKRAAKLEKTRKALLNLTDDEWSKLEIEKVISRFPRKEQKKYRAWVEEITKTVPVFDLVVRRFDGKLQWRLEQEKEWKEVQT